MRNATSIAALAAISAVSPGFAQDISRVERVGALRRELGGGTVVVAVFHVRNLGSSPLRVIPKVELPAGFRLLLPETPLDMPANGDEKRLVSIAIPVSVAAGTYAVRYLVAGASDSTLIVIRERQRFTVIASEVPSFALADSAYEAVFVVTNTGNTRGAVRARVRSSEEFHATARRDVLSVAAGESVEIRVKVNTRQMATRPLLTRMTHHLDLVVTLAGNDSIAATAASAVHVYPRPSRLPTQLHVLPTHMGLQSDIGAGGWTVAELSANGSLRENGAERVQLRVRHPIAQIGAGANPGARLLNKAPQWIPLIGESSIYQFAIEAPRWSVAGGDQYRTLNPLTQTGFSGFGISAQGTRGRVTGSTLWLRDRRRGLQALERGAELGVRMLGGDVSLTYLDRRGTSDSGSTLVVKSQLGLPWGTIASVEYGRARDQQEALAVELRASNSRLWYLARYTTVSDRYPSALRGNIGISAAGSLRVWQMLRVEGDIGRQDNLRDSLAGFMTARGSHARAALAVGSWIAVEQFTSRGQSTLNGGVMTRRDGTRLRLSGSFGAISLGGSAERGMTRRSYADSVEQSEPRPFERYTMRLALQRGGHSISLGGDYSPSAPVAAWQSGPTSMMSILLGTEPWAGSRIRLSLFQQMRAAGSHLASFASDRTTVQADAEQRLPWGHVLTMRTRATLAGSPLRTQSHDVTVGYSVPLGVPIGRRRRSGNVVVRAIDAETKRGVAGVIARLGDRIGITGNDGRATFAAVKTGTYALDANLSALGEARISDRPLPKTVQALGGRTQEIPVSIVRSARVEARIRILAPESTAAGATSAGLEPPRTFVLILASATDTLRRRSDALGYVAFTDLPPGRWMLIASREDLPPHHRITGDSVLLDLDPGGQRKVEIQLVPRPRQMVVVAEQELTLTKPEGRAVRPAIAAPARGTVREAEPAPTPSQTATTLPEARHYYIVSLGERHLSDVALWVYGDARLWPKLLLANRKVVTDPGQLRAGLRLLVPAKAPLTAEEMRLVP